MVETVVPLLILKSPHYGQKMNNDKELTVIFERDLARNIPKPRVFSL